MSKQRNYPEGLAEAVASIPFEQMQDFARKIMQPTTPEPDGMLAYGIALNKGEWPHTMDAAKWADAFNETLVKLGHQPHDSGWLIAWFANAIMAGYDTAQMRDTQTHVAVQKMTEDEALERFQKWRRETHNEMHRYAEFDCYFAALRDLGVILP